MEGSNSLVTTLLPLSEAPEDEVDSVLCSAAGGSAKNAPKHPFPAPRACLCTARVALEAKQSGELLDALNFFDVSAHNPHKKKTAASQTSLVPRFAKQSS